MFSFKKIGDWAGLSSKLKSLASNLKPDVIATIDQSGEMLLKTMQGHIDRQDLNWKPLAQSTVTHKMGDTTIYVDTGYLRNNLEVKRIRLKDYTLFVGASQSRVHPDSGERLSDIAIWLEYGTDKIPPRPLVRPSWEEVEKNVQEDLRGVISKAIER